MAIVINGERVEDAAIRQEVASLRPRYEEVVTGLDPIEAEAQLWEWSRENVIERTLLRQEALKDPEPVPAEQLEEALRALESQTAGQAGCIRSGEADLHRDIEIRLRVDRLLGKVTATVGPARAKEAGEHYRKHRDQFHAPEMVHAAHIVKNVDESTSEEAAIAAIRAAEAELQAGARFEEVADRVSDCPGNGGDLGWFPPGQMVDAFDEVVFALEPGKVSSVFRSPFGFHIAKLYAKRPAGIREFPDVKTEIEGRLLRERQERAIEEFLDRLKARAEIRIEREESAR